MAGAEGLRVVRKERVDGAEEAVGAERAAKDGHQAGGELAERTDEVDVGFATEELAALVETAVVGLDAGLEHEGHLVTVAEVFRTLETEAGAEFLCVLHREGVHTVVAGNVGVARHEGEAGVDEAVDLDVSGLGAHGRSGHGKGEKRLLHHDVHFLMG